MKIWTYGKAYSALCPTYLLSAEIFRLNTPGVSANVVLQILLVTKMVTSLSNWWRIEIFIPSIVSPCPLLQDWKWPQDGWNISLLVTMTWSSPLLEPWLSKSRSSLLTYYCCGQCFCGHWEFSLRQKVSYSCHKEYFWYCVSEDDPNTICISKFILWLE